MKKVGAWAPSTARTMAPAQRRARRDAPFSHESTAKQNMFDPEPVQWILATDKPLLLRAQCERRRCPDPAYFSPAILLADSTVLSSNIAIVMGPTPPGTGLIQAAFWLTGS